MSIVIFDKYAKTHEPYIEALNIAFPERRVSSWSETLDNLQEIEYVLAWRPPADMFEKLPNLKAVFNLGAGVDYLLDNDIVPVHIPIVRLIDPMLDQGMAEYVTWSVLRYHRNLHLYEAQQRDSNWLEHEAKDARQTRVGILGLGELGQVCANALAPFRFQLMGWSRSEKEIDGVTSYFGEDGLDEMLAQTDILICLLPLTPETRGILNSGLLSKLPRGAKLVNAARGEHMISDDIVAALEEGQLEHVTLDVFPKEPLDKDSPLWSHPNVTVTPHIASQTMAHSSVQCIIDNINRMEKGQTPIGLVDRAKGY